jgi:hypothetical protein
VSVSRAPDAGEGPTDAGADDEFEDLPETDIQVEAHVHFGMTGSFPLRIAELFFADDGVHVVEYAYITPMFGLGLGKHRREAGSMQQVYEFHGLDEVLLQGDAVTWLNYETVERVLVHDGGVLARPRIAVSTVDGASYAYRLHDDVDPESLVADLEPSASRHGFEVELESGVGYDPLESFRRFFALEGR